MLTLYAAQAVTLKERISVIIPTLNEEAAIARTVKRCLLDDSVECIVVDGGSGDRTREIASACGAQVVCSAPGRGRQLNEGARRAAGGILLFLHADTLLPETYENEVLEASQRNDFIAGAFRLKIDGNLRGLRIVERVANWRSRCLEMPYGDQALFLRAPDFWKVGGYPELPLMEDFELVRRLRRQGTIYMLELEVLTSARRWARLGVWRTTAINQLAVLAYLAGIRVETIARWYKAKSLGPQGTGQP